MLAALVGGGGEAGRTSDGLPSLDPPCCCPVLGEGFPGAKEPPGMSQKGQQCGCGSPHSMTKWRKKAPLGKKRLQHRWKKGMTGLEEIAVYKISFQGRVWGSSH